MSCLDVLWRLLVGYPISPEFVDSSYPEFLQTLGGMRFTLVITVTSLVLGIPVGMTLALSRTGFGSGVARRGPVGRFFREVLRWLSVAVTETVRGLPIMILVLLAFYLPYPLLGVRIPPSILAIVAFSLYAGVYLGEVFRSGFRAVGEGAVDAARVLGLSRWKIVCHLKIPVMVRTMTPAMLGIAITVFKDTSILTVVAVPELTYTAKQMRVAEPVDYCMVLAVLMAIYWGGATLASVLVRWLESRWLVERIERISL